MNTDRFQQLSEGQRVCLRLVARHLSSKQIARELGISKDTVDQRLDRARKLLGVSDRFEAARSFADFESQYHRVVYDPPPIASLATTDPIGASNDREQLRTEIGHSLREASAEYVAHNPSALRRFRLPLAARGEERNDLSTLERLGWIAVIAIAVPVLLGSLITGLWALGQIARTVTH